MLSIIRKKHNKSREKREPDYNEFKKEMYGESSVREWKLKQKVESLARMMYDDFKNLKNEVGIVGR
jgi:hypothetical protein